MPTWVEKATKNLLQLVTQKNYAETDHQSQKLKLQSKKKLPTLSKQYLPNKLQQFNVLLVDQQEIWSAIIVRITTA